MYNKLFTKILDSTIWLAPDPHRLVWITLLASMDEDGNAMYACAENLAIRARVSVQATEEALEAFLQPDKRDPHQEHDGRRIERIPGGWHLLNAEKYRNLVTRDVARQKTRERVARWREKQRNATCNGAVTPSDTDTDTESEARFARETRAREADRPQKVMLEEAELVSRLGELRAAYPKGLYPQADWLEAEREVWQRTEEGVPWEEILAGVRRYAAHCAAKDGDPQYVKSPKRFFKRRERLWTEPWPIPRTKAETRLASNITAAEEFMRRTEPKKEAHS